MRHAAREHNLVLDAKRFREFFQRWLLRSATDQKHSDLRYPREHLGQGHEQQIETLVGIERTDEAYDGHAVEPERGLKRKIGLTTELEGRKIDGIGDDCDALLRGCRAIRCPASIPRKLS